MFGGTELVLAKHRIFGVIGQNVEVFAAFCVEVFTVERGLRQQPQFGRKDTAPLASFGARKTCLCAA